MRAKIVILLLTFIITSCSSVSFVEVDGESEHERQQIAEDGVLIGEIGNTDRAASNKQFQNYLNSGATTRLNARNTNVYDINAFVRGLSQDLVSNLQYVNSNTPIGVASFVFLDGLDSNTNIVGLQLTESFIHEIHKLGLPVIEHKAMDYIRVTPQGDYLLTRDYLELEGMLPINYVLTGTLVRHKKGYLVNVKVIGMLSKAVVGSAQGFMPQEIIDQMQKTNLSDGLPS